MISDFLQKNEYAISFFIGVIVIAYFAFRQLDKAAVPAEDSALTLLKKHNPRDIAGRSLFFEAYVYFLAFLLILYGVLCFSETFFNLIFVDTKLAGANSSESWLPDSGTWPLAIALLIVGLSPDFPLLRDVELFLRALSQKTAGIPRNFVSSAERLDFFSFQNVETNDPYIKDLREKSSIVGFFLATHGDSLATAEAVQRRLFRFFLLYYWSISPSAPIVWSGESVSKLRLIDDQLKDKCEECRAAFNGALYSITGASWFMQLSQLDGFEFTSNQKTRSEVVEILSGNDREIKEFCKHMKEIDELISENLKKVQVSFCLLFAHDKRPKKYSDPAFQALISQLLSFNTQTMRNLIGITVISIAVTVFFLISLMDFMRYEYIYGDGKGTNAESEVYNSVRVSLRIGFEYCMGAVVIFGSSLVAAILYRNLRDESGKWIPFEGLPGIFPVTQYALVFLFSWIIAFISQNLFQFFYRLQNFESLELYIQANAGGMAVVAGYTVVGPIFSTLFLIWFQKVIENTSGRADFLQTGRVILESFCVAFLSCLSVVILYLALVDDNAVDLFLLTSQNSKVFEILIAFFVPIISGLLVATKMRHLSEVRVRNAAN